MPKFSDSSHKILKDYFDVLVKPRTGTYDSYLQGKREGIFAQGGLDTTLYQLNNSGDFIAHRFLVQAISEDNFKFKYIERTSTHNKATELEVGKELYFRKDSLFHDYLRTHSSDFENSLNTNKTFIFFGKIYSISNEPLNYNVIFEGMKNYVVYALPDHNRTDRLVELLKVFFDEVYQDVYNMTKTVWSFFDAREVNIDHLNYIGTRANIETDKDKIETELLLREFIDTLPWWLKRKGTYSAYLDIFKLLVGNTKNKLNFYERWTEWCLKQFRANEIIQDSDFSDHHYLERYNRTPTGGAGPEYYELFDYNNYPNYTDTSPNEDNCLENSRNCLLHTDFLDFIGEDTGNNLTQLGYNIQIDGFNPASGNEMYLYSSPAVSSDHIKNCLTVSIDNGSLPSSSVFVWSVSNHEDKTLSEHETDSENYLGISFDLSGPPSGSPTGRKFRLWEHFTPNIYTRESSAAYSPDVNYYLSIEKLPSASNMQLPSAAELSLKTYTDPRRRDAELIETITLRLHENKSYNTLYIPNYRNQVPASAGGKWSGDIEDLYSNFNDTNTISPTGNLILSPHYKVEIDLSTEPMGDDYIISADQANELIRYWEYIKPVSKFVHYRWLLSPLAQIDENSKSVSLYDPKDTAFCNTQFIGQNFVSAAPVTAALGPDGDYYDETYKEERLISETDWIIRHNLGTKELIIQTYDKDGFQNWPKYHEFVNDNRVNIPYNSAKRGKVLIAGLKPWNYSHTQSEPATAWDIPHNMGTSGASGVVFESVSISAGVEVDFTSGAATKLDTHFNVGSIEVWEGFYGPDYWDIVSGGTWTYDSDRNIYTETVLPSENVICNLTPKETGINANWHKNFVREKMRLTFSTSGGDPNASWYLHGRDIGSFDFAESTFEDDFESYSPAGYILANDDDWTQLTYAGVIHSIRPGEGEDNSQGLRQDITAGSSSRTYGGNVYLGADEEFEKSGKYRFTFWHRNDGNWWNDNLDLSESKIEITKINPDNNVNDFYELEEVTGLGNKWSLSMRTGTNPLIITEWANQTDSELLSESYTWDHINGDTFQWIVDFDNEWMEIYDSDNNIIGSRVTMDSDAINNLGDHFILNFHSHNYALSEKMYWDNVKVEKASNITGVNYTRIGKSINAINREEISTKDQGDWWYNFGDISSLSWKLSGGNLDAPPISAWSYINYDDNQAFTYNPENMVDGDVSTFAVASGAPGYQLLTSTQATSASESIPSEIIDIIETRITASMPGSPVRFDLIPWFDGSISGSRINLISLVSGAAPITNQSDALTDNFNTFDTSKWTITTPDNPMTITESGTLRADISNENPPDNRTTNIVSKFKVSGDFDVRIDFNFLVGAGSSTGWTQFLRALLDPIQSGRPSNDPNYVYVGIDGQNSIYRRAEYVDGSFSSTGQATAHTNGTFRILRQGATWRTQFKSGDSWTTFGGTPDDIGTEDVTFDLNVSNKTNFPTAATEYDNFLVSAGTYPLSSGFDVYSGVISDWIDITNDPAGPGSGSWTFEDIKNLDMAIDFLNNPDDERSQDFIEVSKVELQASSYFPPAASAYQLRNIEFFNKLVSAGSPSLIEFEDMPREAESYIVQTNKESEIEDDFEFEFEFRITSAFSPEPTSPGGECALIAVTDALGDIEHHLSYPSAHGITLRTASLSGDMYMMLTDYASGGNNTLWNIGGTSYGDDHSTDYLYARFRRYSAFGPSSLPAIVIDFFDDENRSNQIKRMITYIDNDSLTADKYLYGLQARGDTEVYPSAGITGYSYNYNQIFRNNPRNIIPAESKQIDKNNLRLEWAYPIAGKAFVRDDDYYHEQTTAATVWNINHNLNIFGAIIMCYNTDNELIWPKDIQLVDSNNTQITFNSEVAGSAVFVIFQRDFTPDTFTITTDGYWKIGNGGDEVGFDPIEVNDINSVLASGSIDELLTTTSAASGSILINFHVPENEAYTINEMGIFDSEKNLHYYSKLSDLYKPDGVRFDVRYRVRKTPFA